MPHHTTPHHDAAHPLLPFERQKNGPRRLLLTRFTRVCPDTCAPCYRRSAVGDDAGQAEGRRRGDHAHRVRRRGARPSRFPLDSHTHTRTHARTHARTHTHKHAQTHARTHTRPSQPRLNPTDTAATAGTLLAGAWPRGGRAEARPAPIGARGGAERRAALHGVRRLGSLPQPQRRGEVRAAPTSPHDPRPTRRPPASAATCRSDRPSETVGPADRHHVSTYPLLTRIVSRRDSDALLSRVVGGEALLRHGPPTRRRSTVGGGGSGSPPKRGSGSVGGGGRRNSLSSGVPGEDLLLFAPHGGGIDAHKLPVCHATQQPARLEP